MGEPTDTPLEHDPLSQPFGSPVIDLSEVRIRTGRAHYKEVRRCEHKSLIYSREERRVWCEDCTRTIENFEAFLIFTTHFHAMVRSLDYKNRKADEALKSTVTRRATKEIDKAWSGHVMAITCPHCNGGLLPEDFEGGGQGMCSREIELARREKARRS